MSKGGLKNVGTTIKKNTPGYNQFDKQKPSLTAISMLPLKKLTLLNSVPTNKPDLSLVKTSPSSLVKGEVYQERKRMLPEYKELFAALLRLPDKEVQRKIFDVINNHKSVEYQNAETQTDFTESIVTKSMNADETSISSPTSISSATSKDDKSVTKTENIGETTSTNVPKKRKRKRKVSQPQVNKESRAKQLVKMNKPRTTFTHENMNLSSPMASETTNGVKRQRMESTFSECSSDLADVCEDFSTNPYREYKQWKNPLENGLLYVLLAIHLFKV